MSTLEKLIGDTGGCGRFQVCHVVSINSLRMVCVWGLLFMAFGNYHPGWRCNDRNTNATTTLVEDPIERAQSASAFPGDASAFPGSTTSAFPVDLEHVVEEKKNHVGINVSSEDSKSANGSKISTISDNRDRPVYTKRSEELNASNTTTTKEHVLNYNTPEVQDGGAYEMQCKGFSACDDVVFDPSSRTVVTQWGLACDRKWIASLITSIQMAGLFVGCFTSGQISERFGRRKALYGNGALFSLANFAAIFAVSWPMYAACLFFVGLGGVGVMCVAIVYSFEFMEPRWRGVLGGLPLINIGLSFFAFVVFLERDWQYLHATMAAISAVCVLPVLWVPESMRWLAVHGRVGEAKAIVYKMAATNKSQVPDKEVMEVLHSMTGGGQLQTKGTDRKYNYWDLIREKSLRGNTVKLAACWICEVTVYYALSLSVKIFAGDFYVNFLIYFVVEIPVALLVGPMANRWGRKRCGFIFCCVSGLACAALVAVETTTKPEEGGGDHVTAIFVLAAVAKSTISAGRSVTVILTGELPPTVVRSLCYAFCMLSSRFGSIVAPFLVHDANTFPFSFLIMAALSLLTSVIFLTFPETNNRPMADTVIGTNDRTVNVQMEPTSANEHEDEDLKIN